MYTFCCTADADERSLLDTLSINKSDVFVPPVLEEYTVDSSNDEVDGKDVVDVSNNDAEGGNEDIEPTIGYLYC